MEMNLAPIVVLRGPRRVGKTTVQEQFINDLLARDSIEGSRIFRVQFDDIESELGLTIKGVIDPILALCMWFEDHVLGCTFNEAARDGKPAYLFFDEVQNLNRWSEQLKALVDHFTVQVLVTGSSALRIELGRDSLAGRITTLNLGTLSLREIAELRGHGSIPPLMSDNGLAELLKMDFWKQARELGRTYAPIRDTSLADFSERGGYPEAQAKFGIPWPDMADHLNESVIERAIQHDLRIGERGKRRDQQLLEEVFRLTCRYAGQSPGQAIFVNEVKNALGANIGWQRILTYLKFLDGAMLIYLVCPLELRLNRRKGNAKVCLCDHALRASWLQESIPLDPLELKKSPHLSDLAGHIAESVVGSYLGAIRGLDLSHFPERGAEPEVDFIITIGHKRIPLEVKYRRTIDPHRDTLGLRSFMERTVYNAPFGILITMTDDVVVPDPRIVALPLSSFLLIT